MGERRTEKAVRPVLYALADPEMATSTGVFIELVLFLCIGEICMF